MARQTGFGDEVGPGLSVVFGVEEVGVPVVLAVVVDDHKGFTGIVGRSVDVRHPSAFWEAFDLRAAVGPGGATVLADLNIAVVGAHPQGFGVFGRGRNG